MAAREEIIEKIGLLNHMVGVARRIRRDEEAAADPNVARVVALLRLKDGIPTQEMATVLGFDGSAMGATLEAMGESGLVEVRVAEDGSKSVALTEKGCEDAPAKAGLPDVALDGFTDEEADALLGYLGRIEASLTGELGADWKEREEARKAAIDAVRQLSIDVGIPQDLKAIVKEEDLDFLSESAYADACRPGNPRDTSVEEIKALYKKLL